MKNKEARTKYLQRARLGWHRQLLTITLGSVLFLAACASETESFGATEQAFDQAATEDVSGAVEADTVISPEVEEVNSDGFSEPEVVRAPDQTGRLIRRDASVTLEVEDLSGAVKEVSETVVAGDSYLAGEQTDERSSNLTFKVPSADFDRVLEDLPKIGKLRSQQVTSDDRTDVIVDLRSQLETAEKSLERTRGFFEQATSVEDLTRVEAEVAQREAAVASIKAQLQNEERGVSLSTINVGLFLADDLPVELDEDPDAGLLDALSSGFSALTAVLFAFFVVIAWLLPWMPVIGAVLYGARWLRRRAAKRRKERPQTTMPRPNPNQPTMAPRMGASARSMPTPPRQPGSQGQVAPNAVLPDETDDE